MAFCADGGGLGGGEVTFVVFDAGGEVTFVVFDDGGGARLGGGGGHGEERIHALGGPSTDEVPSTRTYDAFHASPLNINTMSVTELVSQPVMSALNANVLSNM